MRRSGFLYWGLIAGILLVTLAGCTFERADGQAGDIADFVPAVATAPIGTGAPRQINTTISLQPANQQLAVGNTTTVEIRVDNVTDLFEVEIQLQFDPNVLQVQDTDSGREGVQIQPGNFLAADFVQTNVADNVTGDIFYTVAQESPTPPGSDSGTLAVVTFQAVAQGSSQLTFAQVELSDPAGQDIPTIAQTGQIGAGQPGGEATPPIVTLTPTQIPESPPPTPTPTATPSPTATPTPTPTVTVTPPPPMAHIPPGATIGFCYRVALGENIYYVAKKFATTPKAISLVNDLYPPHKILAHQALFIPQQLGHGPNVYIFQSGDTLSSIAERCKLPVSMILKVNYLEENVVLQPGHPLIIPIPPFPPPSKFKYPVGPIPIVKYPPPCCGVKLPYRPGPPLYPHSYGGK